ncbi:tetratricopeptide repeat protein [soil metagenome]
MWGHRDLDAPLTPASARARWAPWLAPACVALVTFIAFIPALNNGFVSWDDEKNFLANPHYRGLGVEQLTWMWTTFHMGHYVPLAWMTLGLDYSLWGMNPRGYHLTSLLIHVGNAVALYYLARRLLASSATPRIATTIPAAFAALLFSVHPLRVESVAWATERRDVLSLLFALLCLLSYLRSAESALRWRWYWTSVLLFACALLSKATVVTLPVVLLLVNVHPLRRITADDHSMPAVRRVTMNLLPFALLSLAAMALSVVALHPGEQLSLGGKIAVSVFSLCFYLWKTIVPAALSPLYEMPRVVDPIAERYLASYATALLVTVAALVWRRRWPSLVAAWITFLVLSVPMLGIIQNGPQIAADRYTYHSAPALALLAGVAYMHATARLRSVTVRMASVALALVLVVLTWKQCGVWRDSSALWARVLAVDPGSAYAHSASATLLYQGNRADEGLAESRVATELDPGLAEAHNNVGVGLSRQGRFDEAIPHFRRALELKSSYDEAHSNWGVALARLGDADGAVDQFRRALADNPDNADTHVNWGNTLVRAGRFAEAIQHYEAALAIRPDDADAHLNWGVALARDSQLTAAIEHFRQALALDSSSIDARRYLDRAVALNK